MKRVDFQNQTTQKPNASAEKKTPAQKQTTQLLCHLGDSCLHLFCRFVLVTCADGKLYVAFFSWSCQVFGFPLGSFCVMSTEELRSRLWSCSDLSEAIEVMDKTSQMPSDPQELLKLAQESQTMRGGAILQIEFVES